MAFKFSNNKYWNPAEWVSRTLFRAIDKIPRENTEKGELQIVEKIRKQIKLYVWLINLENYDVDELVLLKNLISKSRAYETTTSEYEEAYRTQIKKLFVNIEETIKMKSS